MKQIIVMVSMILLGIAIAGMVGTFKESASTISVKANEKVENLISTEMGD